MDRRLLNAFIVGLACGIALIAYAFPVNIIADAVYTESTWQPAAREGPTPVPTGNLSEGLLALFTIIVATAIGWILILAAGGALFAWISRGSLRSVRETITWSSITGILSCMAFVIIIVVFVIVNAAISLITGYNLSEAIADIIPGMITLLFLLSPIYAFVGVLGVMAAAIGGFTCRTLVIKKAGGGDQNGS